MKTDCSSTAPSASRRDRRAGLASRSFLALLMTQFLGALNDNLFRWLVVPIGKDLVGDEYAAAALSGGLACFVLPYVLLAAPAGYLADRFSKRTVIVACKLGEIVVMVLGVLAIWYGNVFLLFLVVFIMGSQSALFGPSKFGIIPELLRPDKISSGNGLVGFLTVIAVVGGTVAGNFLYAYTWRGPDDHSLLGIAALAVLGVAGAGWLASLLIAPGRAADPSRRFPINFFRGTLADLRILSSRRALFRVAVGSAFFWSLASLAQLNVDLFAITELDLPQQSVGPLLGVLSLGVGAGSLLAGYWSAGRVELGLVPLGALGMAISSMGLFPPFNDPEVYYGWTCFWLLGLGLSAGLFDVPLQAFVQHRSPNRVRGSVLAAGNFLTFSGMLLVSIVFYLLRAHVELSARGIFLFAGLLTLAVAAYAFFLLPQATIRFVVWLATHTIYRVRIYGRENLPERGGALLVANHVSWLDGVLLLVTSSRPMRMLVYGELVQGRASRWLARTMGAIPIKPTPKATRAAIDEARRALANGELVCIFPEGGITRTGHLQPFKAGVMEILKDQPVPIVPVYLDELWGSIFSYRGGKFFWKWPRRLPYPVSIWFGPCLPRVESIRAVRQQVQDLGAEAVHYRSTRSMLLPRKFLRQCRKRLLRSKIVDSGGADLSGGQLLMRTLILRRLLRRELLAADEQYVGVLLPPSAGGVVVNAALSLDRRVTANLNYTVSSAVMNSCIRQAGIKHVLTSRRVMEKLEIEIDADVVYVEEFRDKVSTADKLIAALQAYLLPAALLERLLGVQRMQADDVFTVIFTSGSTGEPKGVLLSQANVLSNVEAIDQVVQLNPHDVLLGILPFFHSFGFTTTLWTVLGLDIKGAYHFSPLDARQVGKLAEQHRATIILCTPTFLRSYMRRCKPEELASLEVVVVGAEKMPIELAAAFEEKFRTRPVEGYGTTELSPLVSVNVPPSRSRTDQVDLREGTIGHPVPGVSVKVVDLDTFDDLPCDEQGMLLVRGPNVMLGYLNQPEKTAEVMRDGWYITGDIAKIDQDGFITITGRESRFSKIGGEMAPHQRIEEELFKIVGHEEEKLNLAVTSVADERKGERLVVLYTELPCSVDELREGLSRAELPNLWIPARDSFQQVDEIPVLGTGKLDLRGLQRLAQEKLGVT